MPKNMFENKFHGEQISFHVWNRLSGDYFPAGLVRKRTERCSIQKRPNGFETNGIAFHKLVGFDGGGGD